MTTRTKKKPRFIPPTVDIIDRLRRIALSLNNAADQMEPHVRTGSNIGYALGATFNGTRDLFQLHGDLERMLGHYQGVNHPDEAMRWSRQKAKKS